jgi:hypothetical protein
MSAPNGYIPKPKPNSPESGKRFYSNDKIKNLTKQQVQLYIESFFGENGENRSLLQAITPRFINYNISKSFDPQLDPTQKKMQIARYFNELRGVLPCVLIADGGVENMATNVGLISGSIIHQGMWSGFYPIMRKIPLQLVVAARDVDEADEMSGVISLIFNELRNFAGGSYISGNPENGEYWVITLPNGGVNLSSLEQADVQNDPIERVWYATAEIQVMFEDTLSFSQEMLKVEQRRARPNSNLGGAFNYQSDLNNPNLSAKYPPIIYAPETVSLREQVTILVDRFKEDYIVVLSDPRVATINRRMTFTPRMPGKTKVQVIDPTNPDPAARILAEKEITVY